LHRDVSADNIMFDREGNGVLIDWDLAKAVDDLEGGARQNERTVSDLVSSMQLLSHIGRGYMAIHVYSLAFRTAQNSEPLGRS
jgi:serine/threonine protein kinase